MQCPTSRGQRPTRIRSRLQQEVPLRPISNGTEIGKRSDSFPGTHRDTANRLSTMLVVNFYADLMLCNCLVTDRLYREVCSTEIRLVASPFITVLRTSRNCNTYIADTII